MTHALPVWQREGISAAQHVPLPVYPVGYSDPEPVDAPDSYASPDQRSRYLAAMRQRAAQLGARRAVVYLAGIGRMPRQTAGARLRAELETTLAPARLVTMRGVWPVEARPGALGPIRAYPDGLPDMAERIDGMLLVLPPSGRVTAAGRDELATVRAALAPILVRPGWGSTLVPLVDCRVTPDGDRLRVELPARRADRPTLGATLAAMGAEVTR